MERERKAVGNARERERDQGKGAEVPYVASSSTPPFVAPEKFAGFCFNLIN